MVSSAAALAICVLSIVAPIQCNTHSDQNGDEVSLLQTKVIATDMEQVNKYNLDGNEDPDEGNEGKRRENVKDMLGDKILQLQEDSKVKYNLDGNEAGTGKKEVEEPVDCGTDGCLDLRLLPEVDDPSVGGKCMDGTQAGYYYGPPPTGDSGLWVIYLKGGGACYDVDSCKEWGETSGSSGWKRNAIDPTVKSNRRWPERMVGSGKLSIDTSNQVFYNAHHVHVNYCTGDTHGGQIGNPDQVLHKGAYLDGHLNFKRVIEHVLQNTPGANIERVLLYGSSAGGKGVFFNCDWLQSKVSDFGGPDGAVKCAPEGGLFFPAQWQGSDGDERDPVLPPQDFSSWKMGAPRPTGPGGCDNWMNDAVPDECGAGKWMNYIIPTACAAANVGQEEVCHNAGAMYRYIQAPLFVKQDEFDTSPLTNLGFDQCADKHDAQGKDYIRRFGAATRATLKEHKAGDGVFLTSCYSHGGHKATVNGGPGYGRFLPFWFDGEGQAEDFRLMDTCTEVVEDGLPCNPLCDNIDVDCCSSTFMTECIDWIEQGVVQCKQCAEDKRVLLLQVGCAVDEFDSMCENAVEEH